MIAYDLMIKTNHHLIRGGELSDKQKDTIVRKLYANKNTDGRIIDRFQQKAYLINKKLGRIESERDGIDQNNDENKMVEFFTLNKNRNLVFLN